eukprot:TRINITY_DN587_c0_g1_i1.p1 TRINITY_DN587_c0_g1~~TRINITY_DN587_c0_g1_i1.p1  ORF type:complete len:456 (+),score=137.01 TRINITY_DN587_c0_g1_i1:32-1369(+)
MGLPGQYNHSYLDAMAGVVQQLSKHNIYSLVDFHQDLLHPSVCGEGVPDHAFRYTTRNCTGGVLPWFAELIGACKSILDFNMSIDPFTGWPQTSACLNHSFALFYLTPEISSAFQSLYEDHDLQQAFALYWKNVAGAFKNMSSVLGYDLFNEPWPGNIWNDTSLFVPAQADLVHLQPLYRLLRNSIRSMDTESIIFYEGTQFPDSLPVFGGIVSANGFTQTPGGHEEDDRQALSYHVYCCTAGATACDRDGNPTKAAGSVCDKYNPTKVKTRVADAVRLGGGYFMTEFGACTDVDTCVDEIDRTTIAADDSLSSWSYWQYKYFNDVTTQSGPLEGFFDNQGQLQAKKIKALSRTYAQAVQGVPISMSFNTTTSQFQLVFAAKPSIAAPTEIYLNEDFYYPRGFNVLIVPVDAGITYVHSRKNFIQVTVPTTVPSMAQVSVTIIAH